MRTRDDVTLEIARVSDRCGSLSESLDRMQKAVKSTQSLYDAAASEREALWAELAQIDAENGEDVPLTAWARSTGTMVGLYDGIAAGFDTEPGRWQTV